jgi:hypothetical protein
MALNVGGGLFDIILERRESKLFKMLSPGFWVGHLVKREGIWHPAATVVMWIMTFSGDNAAQ